MIRNTIVGSESGDGGTTMSGSVFVGQGAGGTVSTENNNIAIAHEAMHGGTVTADNNIAVGADLKDALTSGTINIFIGKNAGGAVTTTSRGTIGHNAVISDVDYDTVAIGNNALKDVSAGAHSNTAVGQVAGNDLTTADDNVFMGTNAAKENRTWSECISWFKCRCTRYKCL